MTDSLRVIGSRRYGTLSPLRYPGGKAALAGFFADIIDILGIKDARYIEPYAGGVGAGIALLREGIVQHLVLVRRPRSRIAVEDIIRLARSIRRLERRLHLEGMPQHLQDRPDQLVLGLRLVSGRLIVGENGRDPAPRGGCCRMPSTPPNAISSPASVLWPRLTAAARSNSTAMAPGVLKSSSIAVLKAAARGSVQSMAGKAGTSPAACSAVYRRLSAVRVSSSTWSLKLNGLR